MEKQLVLCYLEKIASLDAADIKIKARRGSTFPSKDGIDNIQSLEEYQKELSLRFFTDKELKNVFLIMQFFTYMSRRLQNHEKYYEKLIEKTSESSDTLLVTLIDFFTERIFIHNRSKLLQYLPLFFMSNQDKKLTESE